MKKISFIKIHLFQIITGFFWLALIGIYAYYRISHNLSNEDIAKSIYFGLRENLVFGGVLYILVYLLRTIVFIPASFLVILSPSLFGILPAFIYTVIGENLSAVLGYFLGKFLGKTILSWGIVHKLANMKDKLKKNTFDSIFISRLLFLPFDAVNYLSGFLHLDFRQYFWGTFFGTIPGIFILLFAGAGIKNVEKFKLSHIEIDHKYMIFSGILIIASIIISAYLRKRNKI